MPTTSTRRDVAPVDAAEVVVILGTLAAGLLILGAAMLWDGSRYLLNQWGAIVVMAGVVAGVGAAILWGVTRAQGGGASQD